MESNQPHVRSCSKQNTPHSPVDDVSSATKRAYTAPGTIFCHEGSRLHHQTVPESYSLGVEYNNPHHPRNQAHDSSRNHRESKFNVILDVVVKFMLNKYNQNTCLRLIHSTQYSPDWVYIKLASRNPWPRTANSSTVSLASFSKKSPLD